MPSGGRQAPAAAYPWLDDALRGGADIVTASRRLARELHRVHDERQLAQGLAAWHTPRILSWDAWLNDFVDDAEQGVHWPRRLHPQASAILWERCLMRAAGTRLLDQEGLVRQAREAWRRINEWQVPPEELVRHAGNEDERLFAAAAGAYRRELDTHGWIDAALLPGLVVERLRRNALRAPARVVFAGFDRLTPSARALADALAARGSDVAMAPVPERRAVPRLVSSPDANAELRSAGAWAQARLAENPAARIAIVYPGLEQHAARAERLVREGLAPGWQQGDSAHAGAIQVSYGRKLIDYPLVACAIAWLQWTRRGLSSREISVLLRTRLISSTSIGGCSRLELALRHLPDRRWSAASLAGALRSADESADALAWLARADAVAQAGFGDAPPATPAEWASRIHAFLDQIGWPGERALDSAEFQLVNRWRELLNELTRIEPVRPRLKFGEALARLVQAGAETVWQPEGVAGTVQLLGTLEAAGLEFDHAWVGNLHALQWPPPAHPLPLVSRALQRAAGMPDALPADTLAFAQRTLARLAGSAPSVVLSWPRADREAALAPSPLLAAYTSGEADEIEDPGWYAAALCRNDALQPVAADPVPRVQPDERVLGGASTVQRQVTDPFSAFARGRLGASELPLMQPGLSAMLGGSILHAAVYELLKTRPTSADLHAWAADGSLAPRISAAVDAALGPHERQADGVLRRLLALERRRLNGILLAFAEVERERAPFAIESVETRMHFNAHGVVLELRVDRIDRLADGSLLIIDYKSGAPKALLDRDGQPKDLQLVVYAAALDRDVGALALANLASSGIRYRGIGRPTEWGGLEAEDWERKLDGWKARVDDALRRFAAGDVSVNVSLPSDATRPLSLMSRVEELKREP